MVDAKYAVVLTQFIPLFNADSLPTMVVIAQSTLPEGPELLFVEDEHNKMVRRIWRSIFTKVDLCATREKKEGFVHAFVHALQRYVDVIQRVASSAEHVSADETRAVFEARVEVGRTYIHFYDAAINCLTRSVLGTASARDQSLAYLAAHRPDMSALDVSEEFIIAYVQHLKTHGREQLPFARARRFSHASAASPAAPSLPPPSWHASADASAGALADDVGAVDTKYMAELHHTARAIDNLDVVHLSHVVRALRPDTAHARTMHRPVAAAKQTSLTPPTERIWRSLASKINVCRGVEGPVLLDSFTMRLQAYIDGVRALSHHDAASSARTASMRDELFFAFLEVYDATIECLTRGSVLFKSEAHQQRARQILTARRPLYRAPSTARVEPGMLTAEASVAPPYEDEFAEFEAMLHTRRRQQRERQSSTSDADDSRSDDESRDVYNVRVVKVESRRRRDATKPRPW